MMYGAPENLRIKAIRILNITSTKFFSWYNLHQKIDGKQIWILDACVTGLDTAM